MSNKIKRILEEKCMGYHYDYGYFNYLVLEHEQNFPGTEPYSYLLNKVKRDIMGFKIAILESFLKDFKRNRLEQKNQYEDIKW